MYIATQYQGGIPYARLMESVREGDTVRKVDHGNLGRVLDAERGIYKSRARGVFTYDPITNKYGQPPSDFVPNIKRKNSREQLIVDFGNVFLIDSLVSKYGLDDSIRAVEYGNPDSLRALLLYYILEKDSNVEAETWWEGSYARILYPKANLSSQRISDVLTKIGQEYSLRAFFSHYLDFLGEDVRKGANILIDSTGLPNNINFSLTQVSNHAGEINNEVRLIYVVQQGTRLPIYMRYVPGNIIDTTTLITTIKELKAQGVNTKFAVLDAGYMSQEGLQELYHSGVSFITRCPRNREVYKQAVALAGDLEASKTVAEGKNGKIFNGRLVFVKHVPVTAYGIPLHAYVCKDTNRQGLENDKLLQEHLNGYLSKEDLLAERNHGGVFVLLSTREIRAEEVLSHYYVREDIEQIFDISKNYASLLPLNVEKEETFRGHLLMTFMATVVLQMLQNETRKANISLNHILMKMRNQKAKVFESTVIPSEPVKEQNEIYKLLDIKLQKDYPRSRASV